MPLSVKQFLPDYGVPPGQILEERLRDRGISPATFAVRCDMTESDLDGILNGAAAMNLDIAEKFEREIGLPTQAWLGIERKYQQYQKRLAASNRPGSGTWAGQFPVSELVHRDQIDQPESKADAAFKLLSFFDVDSVAEWDAVYGSANVAYRHSPTFRSDEFALATWLRVGAIEAQWPKRPDYDQSQFRDALEQIRELTSGETGLAFERAQDLCNNSGVALSLLKPMSQTALSGAAWWLTPTKPVIQLSGRYRSNDHLWFTLFHEAAHILLHSDDSGEIIIDDEKGQITGLDAEANEWASNLLIPRQDWDQFVARDRFTGSDVHNFASQQRIAPAIVVGRLQHEKLVPWSALNQFKARIQWVG